MRAVLKLTFSAIVLIITTSGLSHAQTNDPPAVSEAASAPSLFKSSWVGSLDTDALFAQQPAADWRSLRIRMTTM